MSSYDSLSVEAWKERCSRILDELTQVEVFRVVDWSNPWNSSSLNALELRMHKTWAAADDIPIDLVAQYEAFLGEGLRRRFGGIWIRLEPAMLGEMPGVSKPGWGIAYPNSEMTDVVSSLLPFAYRAGTGTWWSSTFHITEQMVRPV